MNSALLIFNSVTQSMKAQTLLNAHGIKAAVERVPKGGVRGCSYCVRIQGEPRAACEMLASNKLPCKDYLWN